MSKKVYSHHKRHCSKHYAREIHYHAAWGPKTEAIRRKQALIDAAKNK